MYGAVIAVAFSLSVSLAAATQNRSEPAVEPCPHPEGWWPEPGELTSILHEHQVWFTAWQKARQPLDLFRQQHPQGRAVLCNAELSEIDWRDVMLAGADLRYAYLYKARLEGASLMEADLSGAGLAGADLRGADLTHAILDGAFLGPAGEPIWRDGVFDAGAARLEDANLNRAYLRDAVLTWAVLDRALLQGTRLDKADLRWAGLRGARLEATSLDGALLTYADLTGARYAPAPSPPHADVGGITGIATLQPSVEGRIGLVQLRELFRKAELRDLERDATFAIERSRTREMILVRRTRTPRTVAEGLFRWVAYDLTVAYGLHPARALLIMLVAGVVLIPVYVVALVRSPAPKQTGAIYRVWPANRIEASSDESRAHAAPRIERLHPRAIGTVAWAAYFSLLSACHIGFREFNVGKWIMAVQAHEYELRATGWVRSVSGLQSLLSLYLLAIWALTYFGRPFG
jgi:uncharacterized protein YjbI with pentapeptide repeats